MTDTLLGGILLVLLYIAHEIRMIRADQSQVARAIEGLREVFKPSGPRIVP